MSHVLIKIKQKMSAKCSLLVAEPGENSITNYSTSRLTEQSQVEVEGTTAPIVKFRNKPIYLTVDRDSK